ncbi:MAG: exodeoxyribonuclease III [Planctomycetes bacterium]|nr:exodeoxyribonuclease III [Planctomycetota bacterium]
MKIATWNVNSIRARQERVIAWLQKANPDVACLQETKVEDAIFPREPFEALGYRCEIFGQKSYNGVAILTKEPATDAERGFPDDGPDAHKRLIAATVGGVRIINIYVPNGESPESEKFKFKQEWLRKLEIWLRERHDPKTPTVLCGDFNIAPADIDVHDPEKWRGKVLFHPLEHEALNAIFKLGLKDAFRDLHSEPGLFSWWDYRGGAFHRGWGLRIDLMLMNDALAKHCKSIDIDREERKGAQPSDHAPVVAEIR